MPASPPTKYTPEFLAKARKYIQTWELTGDKIPSHAGLCVFTSISKTCMYDWEKQEGKEEISDMLKEIMVLQERVLLNMGLSGDFNPTITKLVLSKHKYHDKVDTSHSGAVGMVDLSDKTEAELKEIINGND